MTRAPAASLPALPARDAYRLWAPRYDEENAVSHLEDLAVREATPDLRGLALLDAGCGTGRRLRGLDGPAERVGVDLVHDMLARTDRGRAQEGGPTPLLAAGDLRAIPLAGGRFDVVWCRLVLGHVTAIDRAYSELARVARPGATLIVTDFHPAAIAAGHTRTFRDAAGECRTVEHHVHPARLHEEAAANAGWRLELRRDLAVGPAVRPFYERAGALRRYHADVGLPLVLLLRFVA